MFHDIINALAPHVVQLAFGLGLYFFCTGVVVLWREIFPPRDDVPHARHEASAPETREN